MVNTLFVSSRLTELRLQKDKSASLMGEELGFGSDYIRHITSREGMPTFEEFFAICDYLEVTPEEFFREEQNAVPSKYDGVVAELKKLNQRDFNVVMECIACLNERKNQRKN